ncbi:MAG: DUF4118 domain-containing protein [Acidobacteriia bacterium]|nr:DUF4118 domain-containing protein [Terriglobia bacterium]
MAIPKQAKAYVDPGSGAMIWQIAAAAAIGSLFYARRALMWMQAHLGLHSNRSMGFLFASLFAVVTSPVICTLFNSHPVPRFNDVFLVGIVLTAYLFTWEPAVYLLAISVAVSAWVLPPAGSFAIAQLVDWYRLISFAILSVFLIVLVTRLKARARVVPQQIREARHTETRGRVMAVGQ